MATFMKACLQHLYTENNEPMNYFRPRVPAAVDAHSYIIRNFVLKVCFISATT